ncbi:periplasmic binding protein-like I [Lobosporangium transversale]|uniref:Periplasmic binding protein-like I n=1 Tax=Lobosporangium transversale TaxID=64571 RepID=A0A1Y2GYY0_9FUNG|nr:periplasmic binding protein-like I [Lobosporangium transversale]ORZ27508.1 periplasmic binding protein-like I [Lobosporangium transversale]|eukprot:XP_021885235.1 periplasmic binding protein-like I [Lobosporangium transversale]
MASRIRKASEEPIDGLIVTIPNSDIAAAVIDVQRQRPGLPIVVMNIGLESARQQGFLSVLQNNVAAGELIGNALLDKGARSFVCLGAVPFVQTFADRCSGVLKAFRARGLNLTDSFSNRTIMVNRTNDSQQVFRTVKSHLGKYPNVDSIIALSTLTVDLAVEISLNKTGNPVPGRPGGLWVGTFELNENMIEYVKSGTIVAATSQSPYLQGAIPVLEIFLMVSSKQRLQVDTIWTGPTLLDASNVEAEYAQDHSGDLFDFIAQNKTAVVFNRNISLEKTRWKEALGGIIEATTLFGWNTISATSVPELEGVQNTLLSAGSGTTGNLAESRYGPYKGIQGVIMSLADKEQYSELLNNTVMGPNMPIMGIGTVDNWVPLPSRVVFHGPSDTAIGSTFSSQILKNGFGIPLCLIELNGPWWQEGHCIQLHKFLATIYGEARVGRLEDMMMKIDAKASDLVFNSSEIQERAAFHNEHWYKRQDNESTLSPDEQRIINAFSEQATLPFDSILCTSIPLYEVVAKIYPNLKKIRGSAASIGLSPLTESATLREGLPLLSKAAPDSSSPGVFVMGTSTKAIHSLANNQYITGILNPQQYIQGFHSVLSLSIRMMYPNRAKVFNQFLATGPVPINYVCEPGTYYSSGRSIPESMEGSAGAFQGIPMNLSPYTSTDFSSEDTDTVLCVDPDGHVKVRSMCTRCSAGTYSNYSDALKCSSCPSGLTTTGVGQVSCVDCSDGNCGSSSGICLNF